MKPKLVVDGPASEWPREPRAVFTEHLAVNARWYFPDLGNGVVAVDLHREGVRPASILYDFEIRAGDDRRRVVVKVPRVRNGDAAGRPAAGAVPDRPRLVQPALPEEKFLLEHAALTMIHGHFRGLRDARFGAVRPLDLLPEHRALVMETARGRTLRELYNRLHRGRGGAVAADLEEAFRNTGAWLRAYHAVVPPSEPPARQTMRSDLVRAVERFAEYLGRRTGESEFFESVASAVSSSASSALPEEIPLGLGHGDFAPRNVLVAEQSRITVLDTLARWRVPIYEDIGCFLVSLRYNWLQVLSAQAAFPSERVALCEQAFLSGYFADQPVPHEAVRLYRMQAMLDLWSAVAWRQILAPGPRERFQQGVKLTLLSRQLRRALEKELRLDHPSLSHAP